MTKVDVLLAIAEVQVPFEDPSSLKQLTLEFVSCAFVLFGSLYFHPNTCITVLSRRFVRAREFVY